MNVLFPTLTKINKKITRSFQQNKLMRKRPSMQLYFFFYLIFFFFFNSRVPASSAAVVYVHKYTQLCIRTLADSVELEGEVIDQLVPTYSINQLRLASSINQYVLVQKFIFGAEKSKQFFKCSFAFFFTHTFANVDLTFHKLASLVSSAPSVANMHLT